MTERIRIIERIKLLLNLGKSPNPNEAETAVAKAMLLMDEYDISREEVDKAVREIESFEVGPLAARIEHRCVVNLLVVYFRVKCMTMTIARKRKFMFYGEPHNIEIAKMFTKRLLRRFRAGGKREKATFGVRTATAS